VRYKYWKPGDKLPKTLPKGCEYQCGYRSWAPCRHEPDCWSSLPRRWPVPSKRKPKPKPDAGMVRILEKLHDLYKEIDDFVARGGHLSAV
jgi:hypothetical protein